VSTVQPVPLKTPTFTPSEPQRYIQIDEDGYFKMGALSGDSSSSDTRVSDEEIGRTWMASIQHDPTQFRVWMHMENQDVIVEAFDAPYVALQVAHADKTWCVTMPYGHRENFSLETLSLDEWDRFHGRTERGIPFVFSRPAQASFFDLLDEYDDDSITVDGRTFELPAWLHATSESEQTSFWSERYARNETPWDLNGAHPSLPRVASAVKIQRSRILVLGCGRGHDAAWFARAGHIVTAIDYSEDAIKEARKLYSEVPDLTFVREDAFALPAKYDGAFDIVFDHTLYCAIDPTKRNDLVKTWRRALTDDGHLLGIFFCNEKLKGPPYGGSEWELRQRFNKHFRPLYWQRLKDSPEQTLSRLGNELFIYSQKLSSLR
jgi:SAM-dependent methyltransferase